MSRIRLLGIGIALYVALTMCISGATFALLGTLSGPLSLWLLAANIVAWTSSVVFVSRWIVRRSGERDIILPVVAYALGTTIGTVALMLIAPALSSDDMVYRAIQSLTLGLITSPDQGVNPGMDLAVGSFKFGIGVPWALLLIYSAVFFRTKGQALGRQA